MNYPPPLTGNQRFIKETAQAAAEDIKAAQLTKREQFAMAAMQGVIANSVLMHSYTGANGKPSEIAMVAVSAADALIKELKK